jgi:hypothetical protein
MSPIYVMMNVICEALMFPQIDITRNKLESINGLLCYGFAFYGRFKLQMIS